MLKTLLLTLLATGCVAEVEDPVRSDQPEEPAQPEPPVTLPNIKIAKASCTHVGGAIDVIATIEATLPVGNATAFDASFVDYGTVTQLRTYTRFACGSWHRSTVTEQQPGFDVGCDRAVGQPETQQITMRHTIVPEGGTLPASVDVALSVAVTTKPIVGDWMQRDTVSIACE